MQDDAGAEDEMVRHATTLQVAGMLDEEQVGEVADLFVRVDASFGDQWWWTPVRHHGLHGARQVLALGWWRTVVARGPAGDLVGFAGLVPARTAPGWELCRVMVHPDWQHRGIATAMCQRLLDEADTEGAPVVLNVLFRTPWTIRMYHRLGFRPADVAQMDQPDFECLVMVRPSGG